MKKMLVLSSVLLLAACGGGDKLSKSAVQKAVNASAKFHSVCVPFQLTVDTRKAGDNPVLGSPEVKLVKRQDNGKRANLTAIDQMEVLTDAGLYRRDKEQREGEGDNAVRYMVYSLTKKGEDTFQALPNQEALMCIGNEKVEKINFFTAPTPSNGVTVTQVSYEAKINAERWAKKLLKDSPYYNGLNQTQTKHATLVKTNDGWRDIMDLRNQ
ncbi:hypothetical protein [Kingella oralis]|jgi:hypothetical protein|uniref:hypothetical protein n=1 Tax=Kingella oralis TaxID=505 RepID=UPI0028E39B87|nr:hypothetical protein [Kingella oralis]